MSGAAYAAVIAGVLGFAAGWQVSDWRHEATDAERAQQQQKADDAQAVRADSASASHEGVRDQLRTEFQIIYRDRDRVIEKPVYRNVCLDADGLRLVRSAIGKPSPTASQPAPAVSGPE